MSENFIGNILKEEIGKESKFVNSKKELFGKFRSSSAPPEIDNQIYLNKEEKDNSSNEEYYNFYNNRMLNPRLPQPLTQRNNWFSKVNIKLKEG
jgi:hypothetical protein